MLGLGKRASRASLRHGASDAPVLFFRYFRCQFTRTGRGQASGAERLAGPPAAGRGLGSIDRTAPGGAAGRDQAAVRSGCRAVGKTRSPAASALLGASGTPGCNAGAGTRAETGGGCQAKEAGRSPIDWHDLDRRSATSGPGDTLAIRLGATTGRDGATSQPLIHQADALPISAVFRMRYLHDLMRRWAASRRLIGVRRQIGA